MSEEIEQEPLVKGYNHKPYLVPPGKTVYECCLINGRVRPAEWQDVQSYPPEPTRWQRLLIRARLRKKPVKLMPIMQLVEYDDCIYIPCPSIPDKREELKRARKEFERLGRMSSAKFKTI